MSETDQFWQYAREAMLLACDPAMTSRTCWSLPGFGRKLPYIVDPDRPVRAIGSRRGGANARRQLAATDNKFGNGPQEEYKSKKGDLHHSANFARLVPYSTEGNKAVTMTYDELVELAGLCSRNSRIATSREVAIELWRMAKEYQAQAWRVPRNR